MCVLWFQNLYLFFVRHELYSVDIDLKYRPKFAFSLLRALLAHFNQTERTQVIVEICVKPGLSGLK